MIPASHQPDHGTVHGLAYPGAWASRPGDLGGGGDVTRPLDEGIVAAHLGLAGVGERARPVRGADADGSVDLRG